MVFARVYRAPCFEVVTHKVDVSNAESVAEVARAANALGRVKSVVHTAGLSPAQASADAILHVDLLGVAHTLDEFGKVIAKGGAGIVIASVSLRRFGPESSKPGPSKHGCLVAKTLPICGLLYWRE